MAETRLNASPRILQVSTQDAGGGAEKVAWNLFETYRRRGYHAWLAVGRKLSDDPDVFVISNENARGLRQQLRRRLHAYAQSQQRQTRVSQGFNRLGRLLAEPRKKLDQWMGIEDFHFSGTWRLLQLPPQKPDIMHCHNLHGEYFDLRALADLSQRLPVVLTLHDAWLLSGHCAHSFDCERWKIGCGHCPDLTIPPAVRRDTTAYNWRRKRDIFRRSRLHVATPSRWLMQKVEQSILAPALAEAKVIHNGIDLSLFKPQNKMEARATLEIPPDTKILLFAANGIRGSRWKDYATMQAAVNRVAERAQKRRLLFIALGDEGPSEHVGQTELRFVPFQKDPASVAQYYQAADVYLHAAFADTFPTVVLEALACGTPVIATAVGGIPEQIRGLLGSEPESLNQYAIEKATGILVAPGDAQTMAVAVERLLNDDALCSRLSTNAATDAKNRFDLERQADDYLSWYEELLNSPVAP